MEFQYQEALRTCISNMLMHLKQEMAKIMTVEFWKFQPTMGLHGWIWPVRSLMVKIMVARSPTMRERQTPLGAVQALLGTVTAMFPVDMTYLHFGGIQSNSGGCLPLMRPLIMKDGLLMTFKSILAQV